MPSGVSAATRAIHPPPSHPSSHRHGPLSGVALQSSAGTAPRTPSGVPIGPSGSAVGGSPREHGAREALELRKLRLAERGRAPALLQLWPRCAAAAAAAAAATVAVTAIVFGGGMGLQRLRVRQELLSQEVLPPRWAAATRGRAARAIARCGTIAVEEGADCRSLGVGSQWQGRQRGQGQRQAVDFES